MWVLQKVIGRTSVLLEIIAGLALVFILLLTTADVLLRMFGHPIIGTYEVVGFAGALVVGLVIPEASRHRAHVTVELVLDRLPPLPRALANALTRVLAIGLFALLAVYLASLGLDLAEAGEVSPTLQLPFYPVVYGLAFSCALECLVLMGEIVPRRGWRHE